MGTEKKYSRSTFNFALTVAVFLVLAMAVLAFYFFNNWKHTEARLEAALAREQQLVHTFRTMESQVSLRDEELAVVRDPQYRPVPMVSLEAAPAGSAVVYWNPQSRQVYLYVRELPDPPVGQQYQLWALYEGEYRDAGLIPVHMEEGRYLQPMTNVGEARGFLITREPEGGSPTPSRDSMYLAGNIER
jgi:anti-sigma-K factor RskA